MDWSARVELYWVLKVVGVVCLCENTFSLLLQRRPAVDLIQRPGISLKVWNASSTASPPSTVELWNKRIISNYYVSTTIDVRSSLNPKVLQLKLRTTHRPWHHRSSLSLKEKSFQWQMVLLPHPHLELYQFILFNNIRFFSSCFQSTPNPKTGSSSRIPFRLARFTTQGRSTLGLVEGNSTNTVNTVEDTEFSSNEKKGIEVTSFNNSDVEVSSTLPIPTIISAISLPGDCEYFNDPA